MSVCVHLVLHHSNIILKYIAIMAMECFPAYLFHDSGRSFMSLSLNFFLVVNRHDKRRTQGFLSGGACSKNFDTSLKSNRDWFKSVSFRGV